MKPILIPLGVVCLLTVSLAAQSLGDVAKKAEEERKVQKPASRTYTDKDLKDASGPATTQAASPAPSSLAATSATSGQRESDRADEYRKIAKKDEAHWKDRMRAAQLQLDGDRAFLAAATARERDLERRLHRGEADLLYIRDGRLRAAVEDQWQAAITEVSRLKALIETDRLGIASLEEEARRASVPPGWLRP